MSSKYSRQSAVWFANLTIALHVLLVLQVFIVFLFGGLTLADFTGIIAVTVPLLGGYAAARVTGLFRGLPAVGSQHSRSIFVWAVGLPAVFFLLISACFWARVLLLLPGGNDTLLGLLGTTELCFGVFLGLLHRKLVDTEAEN